MLPAFDMPMIAKLQSNKATKQQKQQRQQSKRAEANATNLPARARAPAWRVDV